MKKEVLVRNKIDGSYKFVDKEVYDAQIRGIKKARRHKIKRLREYQVSIPYTHVFVVEAFNKKDALKKAHASCDGEIVDYDDSKAEIEEGPYVD